MLFTVPFYHFLFLRYLVLANVTFREIFWFHFQIQAICTAVIKGFIELSDHPLISRFLKGIYNRHPVLPKYSNTWDMSLLLKYYNSIDNNESVHFKDLVKKTSVIYDSGGTKETAFVLYYCG